MPFEISSDYLDPRITFIPNRQQLLDYIEWLLKELAVAREELKQRRRIEGKEKEECPSTT